VTDLVGEVERRPRKPWITQKIINKMDGRRKWQNAVSKVERKNYRNLRNLLTGAKEKLRKNTLRKFVAR
jgi:hypothetical protein